MATWNKDNIWLNKELSKYCENKGTCIDKANLSLTRLN